MALIPKTILVCVCVCVCVGGCVPSGVARGRWSIRKSKNLNTAPHGMVWYGMVEVCEGAPVAVSGWVLAVAFVD